MIKLHEKFVVNEQGNRIGVILDMNVYRKILEMLEEMEDVNAFDEAKASNQTLLPFDEAVRGIEKNINQPGTRNAKAKFTKAIDELPEDTTIEDAMECLYFLFKIEKGIHESETGKKIPHEMAKKRMKNWLD